MIDFPAIDAQLHAADLNTVQGKQQLDALWQQAACHRLVAADGIEVCLWQLPAPVDATAALIIVPGRIEAAHKYVELCLDAKQCGYQVFVIDHRGQGLSDRLCDDPQVGVVDTFDDYTADFHQSVLTIRDLTSLPLLAIAHSMGSAVLYRYLQQYPSHPIAAAVCCAPMFGIPVGPWPQLVQHFANAMGRLNRWLGATPWYVPGQGAYQPPPFSENELTLCVERYQWFRNLYDEHPRYQLGGVSWYWLAAALSACKALSDHAAPNCPVLVIQAGADTVVSNSAQIALQARHGFTLHCLPFDRHELWASPDSSRNQLLNYINHWLQTSVTGKTGSA